jgi:hypothetical protein
VRAQSSRATKTPTPASAHKTAITEDSIVNAGPVVFQDIANQAGLTTWKHTMGAVGKGLICDVNSMRQRQDVMSSGSYV